MNPEMVQGGAAEHIGRELDTRLRDHLRQRSNLFAEGAGGLGASLSRPLLCLFERNFELSVVSWKDSLQLLGCGQSVLSYAWIL